MSLGKGYKHLYPDVQKSRLNSIKHFFFYGFWEGRYLSYIKFKSKEKYILNKIRRLGVVDENYHIKLNRFKNRNISIFALLIFDISKKLHNSRENIDTIRIENYEQTKNFASKKIQMKKSQLLFKTLIQEKSIIVHLMGRTLFDSELRLIRNNFPGLKIVLNDFKN